MSGNRGMWDQRTPHQRFWDNLVNGALDRLLQCPDQIKALRYDYEEMRRVQKTLGLALDQRGTSMMRLVAEAHGEIWDAEDDEKQAARQSIEEILERTEKSVPLKSKGIPVTEEDAIQMGAAREVGVREGQGQGHDLPPSHDRRKELLHKVR